MADVINIEILPDGTIKSTTDRISAANHSSADGFFRYLSSLVGGSMTRKAKSLLGHIHTHGKTEHRH
jgi:hypothetical protein